MSGSAGHSARFRAGRWFPAKRTIVLPPPQVREVKEELPVAQAKLVMGFRTGIFQPQKEVAAMRMAMTIFGGTPSSKLFVNVRESRASAITAALPTTA